MTYFQMYALGVILYGIFAIHVIGSGMPRGPMPRREAALHAFCGTVAIIIGALLWPLFLSFNIINTLRQ